MSKASINSLSLFEENSVLAEKSSSQPGVYSGQFTASVIQDTYLDTSGWGKGQLFINGYNIGRYWPTAGPQVRIYILPSNVWIHLKVTLKMLKSTESLFLFGVFRDKAVYPPPPFIY